MNVREAALKVLYEIDVNKAYSNLEIANILGKNDFDSRDKALLSELVYGSIKNKIKLDYVISLFSKVKPKKISPWVLNIIRLGIYQILFLEKIPESAACNESVKLARKYSNHGGAGFVNGILRNICRNKESISYPEKSEDKIKYYSVKYSFPEWMVSRFINQYGEEKAELFMEESNKPHFVYLRVNELKTSALDLIKLLEKYDVKVYETEYSENMLAASGNFDLTKTDEYKNGLFSFQNISSKKSIDILAPEKGDVVMDVCAAPGGKSCAAAERMKNCGEIYSFDIYEHKINLIENSAKRLGIEIIKTEIGDARILKNDFIEKADKVIVDAPCSGIGTIHKKPDIKWKREESDIKELSELQNQILSVSSMFLKKGGILLYSTCTVFK